MKRKLLGILVLVSLLASCMGAPNQAVGGQSSEPTIASAGTPGATRASTPAGSTSAAVTTVASGTPAASNTPAAPTSAASATPAATGRSTVTPSDAPATPTSAARRDPTATAPSADTATASATAAPSATIAAPTIAAQDAGAAPAADVTVGVDGAQQFQKIDGLGVNANSAPWQSGHLAPALDLLTNTLGASIWRVIVESHENWETTNDNADPFTFNWDYYNQLYETPKFQALWGVLQYLDQKHVPKIYLNVMGCLPEWMGRCSLNPDAEDEWVEMIASLLYYARNTKHLRVDIVGPMNEEDNGNPEGPKVDADQYVRVMGKLSARLDALGLGDIELLGPDTAAVGAAAGSYMPAMLADSALMAKVRHFAAHSYNGDAGALDATIKGSAYADRNFWMTEFSEWCQGCDTGTQPTNDWEFAVQTVERLFQLLDQGASSALVYDAYDSFYEHHGSLGYWGLLGIDAQSQTYVPRKRFYTLAQVFKFVPPGMRLIGVDSQNPDVHMLAFANQATGEITIVGHNSTSAPLTIGFQLRNLAAVDKLFFYQTTATMDMAQGADVPVANQAFSAQVAGDSIFTLSTKRAVSSADLSVMGFVPFIRH